MPLIQPSLKLPLDCKIYYKRCIWGYTSRFRAPAELKKKKEKIKNKQETMNLKVHISGC
jgi:hypothetical protein